ncbi:MAG: amino acid adenylation domain-containing protein [Alphaproteobacteria bacterium]|nr:amino acid adenylation domain-containing protein [Alphaproteobacteria bacterium]
MKQFWPQFLEIARQYPDAIAVKEDNKTLTYSQLAALAAALGENLKKKGVTLETPVALEMEKSAEYIIALLGCWYAGAAFVPLPPSLPQKRRDYIIRHADIRHAVSAYDIKALQPWTGDLHPAEVREDTLAYIIYTSGSTGTPKGVMVEHRGIVNFIEAQINAFKTLPGSQYLFYLSILFDASISDIGVALLSGATLVIEPQETLLDGGKLLKHLHELNITHTDIPPSLLKAFRPEDMPGSLKTIIIGGEACPPETVRNWARRFRVVNVYGPTEATVCTSICLCDPVLWEKPLIGDPLPGIRYLVLEGELYIGGIGLARGYLKQPELTGEKFITHDGARLYKTGDKVRRLADGSIEFLGRIDRQFKLRGQLVEPDEIEAKLSAHPAIIKAAVIKRDERLLAFVMANQEMNPVGLEKYLGKSLPAWMIPQHFEFLAAMPLTATGKTDYAALKAMPLRSILKTAASPGTEAEKKLWQIWVSILKHENFGVTDDFFSVGGDSLGIIRMTLEAERQGLPFMGSLIAECRTIRKLAQAMEGKTGTADVLPCEWLKKDIAFDGAWQELLKAAQARPALPPSAPKHIFLTGAAGFLGSRVLSELLQKTDADIHCLIRAENAAAALERIKKTVHKSAVVFSETQLSRIKPLCGDLSDPHFGLSAAEWSKLAETIDDIYHCAAKVNMLLPYRDLRATNVEATQEVLRFACTGKRKHLHHASTLSVFVATDRNSGRLMETDHLEKTQRVYGGYAQTKWAAEYMLLQVPKDACAITHYRFGLITGDTKTGVCSENDFLTMFVKGIASLRAVPEGFNDKLHVDITPVDYAAAAMVHLSLHGKNDIYHIANPHSLSLGRFLEAIRRKDIKIVTLPAARWKEVVENKSMTTEETAAGLSLCRCLPEEFEKHRTMDLFQATGVVFDTTHTENDLQGSGIACPEISDQLLDTYLGYMLKDRKRLVKICIFGPESTGKSTLAEKLAAHYKTAYAPEFAKELIFAQNGNLAIDDIPRIAQGQLKNETEAAKTADRVLFCDSDLITTTIWSDRLFGQCPQWVRDAADLQEYAIYLLMDIDTPWVADVHRFLPEERQAFLEKCRSELDGRKIQYTKLSGGWDHKFDAACRTINELLQKYG